MKATDLMIRDWVFVDGLPTRVTDIDELEGINRKWIGGAVCEDAGCISWEHIKPILLTPEILEKTGWFLDEIDGSYRNPYNGFWIGGRNAPFCMLVSNLAQDINYVHELQHALKLCGIEKEIVL